MIRSRGTSGGLVLCALVLAGCGAAPATSPTPGSTASPTSPPVPPTVVVFTGTGGFRHESIDAGREALREIAGGFGAFGAFEIVETEDPAEVRAELASASALVLLNTTGDVFDARTEGVVERFVDGGGGLVGVHAATDTEHDWAWYRDAIGAEFVSHPAVQEAVVRVVAEHPSVDGWPREQTRRDEWYNFAAALPPDFTLLLSVEEASYDPGADAMGAVHPVAWCRSGPGEGEVWYTALGHESSAYADRDFRALLAGGIASVLGDGCQNGER